MRIEFSPVRMDGPFEVDRQGAVLTINGIAYDMSTATIETCPWLAEPVEPLEMRDAGAQTLAALGVAGPRIVLEKARVVQQAGAHRVYQDVGARRLGGRRIAQSKRGQALFADAGRNLSPFRRPRHDDPWPRPPWAHRSGAVTP